MNIKIKIEPFLISQNVSIKEAMRQMNEVGERVLFVVVQQKKLIGSLTDGDIRRWVLKEGSLLSSLNGVYNLNPISFKNDYDLNEVKNKMLETNVQYIPIVDKYNRIKDILIWSQIFGNGTSPLREKIENIPVVVMAGGKGSRLDPFTKILPKPLIPIGDKPIIEIILEKFREYDIEEFFITVHHKSRMIKAFFEEMDTSSFKIHYIEEEKPLGTAGSLRFLSEYNFKSYLVSNCDIIIEADYAEICRFHEVEKYDMTIVGSFRHFMIPYGVCTIENGGILVNIHEKPEYDFLVNTGMYVINKEILKVIPQDQEFNINELINKAKKEGFKIGVFPINEKSWIDVGQWEEYHKGLKHLLGDLK